MCVIPGTIDAATTGAPGVTEGAEITATRATARDMTAPTEAETASPEIAGGKTCV